MGQGGLGCTTPPSGWSRRQSAPAVDVARMDAEVAQLDVDVVDLLTKILQCEKAHQGAERNAVAT